MSSATRAGSSRIVSARSVVMGVVDIVAIVISFAWRRPVRRSRVRAEPRLTS
jgi:hypothetical protein